MSTVATTITDSIFIILDEGNDEGSEFALVPLATTRIVAHHGAARLMVIWRETGGGVPRGEDRIGRGAHSQLE